MAGEGEGLRDGRPNNHIVHGRDYRRRLVDVQLGQPVDQQAQLLRNLAGLLVENDTEPVANLIADGAAVAAVYLYG